MVILLKTNDVFINICCQHWQVNVLITVRALRRSLKLQCIHKNAWQETKLNTSNWIGEIIKGLLYYKIDDGRNSIPISPHRSVLSSLPFFHSLLECSFSSELGLWILPPIFYSVKELWHDRHKQTLQGFICTWFAFLEGIFFGQCVPLQSKRV